MRNFSSTGSFGEEDNLSIGNDCAAVGVVSVGGRVTGTIPHSLTWGEVKSHYDTSGPRLEEKSWLASFGLAVEDVEDGFRPRVPDGTEADNEVAFLLSGGYWTGSSSSPPKLPWSSRRCFGSQ